MDQRLSMELQKRENEGTLRSLSLFNNLIDFYSNDYLGMAKMSFGPASSAGSTGSRLISGNCAAAEDCEFALAKFFTSESALIFNSGYDANVGLFSAVPQKGDTVLYDEFIHASIRDGVRLSFASNFSFRHNDILDLSSKISRAKGTIYVVVESLYSMNGDIAPLGKIHTICKEYGAFLIIDEAHSCGIFGENGKGIADGLMDNSAVFARIVTFGKAYGYHGAAVLGTKELTKYLMNFARSFIYTTALPEESYKQISSRFNYDSIALLQQKLQVNVKVFRAHFSSNSLNSEINSPIQIIRIGNVSKTKELAARIINKGFAVKPIYSPTVANGHEGLRICLHSFNEQQDIIKLASIF